MKYHFFSIKHVVKQLFVAGLFIAVSAPVFAHKNNQAPKAEAQSQPELQVISSDNSNTMLSLQFSNEQALKFNVEIREINGELLFRKNYNASAFFKKFQLINESGVPGTDFNVAIQLANGKEYNYTVSNTVSFVTEVQITKQ